MESFIFLGDAAEFGGDEAAEGGDVWGVDFDVEGFFDFVDLSGAEDFEGISGDGDDGGFFFVEFVLDVTDEFFEDIFEGKEADDAIEFVDDEGHVDAKFE